MAFEPQDLFTQMGTLITVWVFSGIAYLSFLGARRLLHEHRPRRFLSVVAADALVVVGTLSGFVVLAWVASRHL